MIIDKNLQTLPKATKTFAYKTNKGTDGDIWLEYSADIGLVVDDTGLSTITGGKGWWNSQIATIRIQTFVDR